MLSNNVNPIMVIERDVPFAHDTPLRSVPFGVRITDAYLATALRAFAQIFAFGENFRYASAVIRNSPAGISE